MKYSFEVFKKAFLLNEIPTVIAEQKLKKNYAAFYGDIRADELKN